jgi:hypothetical protein
MEPLWQKLLLALIGPVVGTLIIGGFLALIARRAAENRADAQLREERLRSENRLRFDLISQATESASALYMAMQHFWRKKDREKTPDDKLAELREALDQQYRTSRVAGEVLERKLEAYFLSDAPRASWHAVMDLLTVCYFQLIGLATPKLLELNSGPGHSGLTVAQLADRQTVLDSYRTRIAQAARCLLEEPIRPFSG